MASDLPYLRAYPWRCRSRHAICWSRGNWQTCCCASIPNPQRAQRQGPLYDYVQELKIRYLRNAGTVNKVLF